MMIAATVAWLLAPVLLVAPEASPSIKPAEFPVVAASETFLSDDNLKSYKHALFNIVQVPASDEETVRRTGAAGFQVVLTRPEETGKVASEWAARAKSLDSVVGWAMKDPVTEARVSDVAGWMKDLRTADPGRRLFACLPQSSEGNWGRTLGELVRAGLPAMMVRRSDWRADGSDDNIGFCTDLEALRQVSTKIGVPVWGMIHVVRSGSCRWASSSDLRFQVYSYLAAGARGLWYLTAWPSVSDLAAAAPDTGEETADPDQMARRVQYELDAIADINREIAVLVPTLKSLKSTGLFFIGGAFIGLPQLVSSRQLVTSVTAEAGLVGMFTDQQGNAFAMVVNARHGKQMSSQGQKSTFRVAVDSRVSRVTELDRVTAYEKEVPLESGAFFVTIPGGTGCLFRLETSSMSATK